MNLLSKLFGSSNMNGHSNGNGIPASSAIIEDDIVNVSEILFVDPNPPVQSQKQESPHGLQAFIEQDFFRKGYDDGYNWHSAEMLDNKVKSLKSDFRYNISLKIEQVRREKLELQKQKINIGGMSERLDKQLDVAIASFQEIIDNLDNEKVLSSEDEGLAMTIIHQYRDGFVRGTETYQQEKLLASSTGMFN